MSERGFFDRTLDRIAGWVDTQTRFVAALAITTLFMLAILTVVSLSLLVANILWTLGGLLALVVGFFFLFFFFAFYSILGAS